jgi:heme-degrading monooxygenase HmoA
MHTRIVWGRILPGKWDEYEAAYKAAIAARGPVDGLLVQWLARDEKDSEAGYSVSVWQSKEAMTTYVGSKKHKDMTAPLMPFFVNQYTSTHCEIRHYARGVPQAIPGGDLDIYHTN